METSSDEEFTDDSSINEDNEQDLIAEEDALKVPVVTSELVSDHPLVSQHNLKYKNTVITV